MWVFKMKEELRKITHVQGIVLVTNPLHYLSCNRCSLSQQHVRTAHPAVSSKLPELVKIFVGRDQGSTEWVGVLLYLCSLTNFPRNDYPATPDILVVAAHPLITTSMLLVASARSAYRTPGLGRRAASAIASKYSKAVFGAAISKSPQTLTQVHNELSNVSKAIKANPDIRTFVNNPTLSLQERNKGLQELFLKLEGTGARKDKYSDVTRNFLVVLSENGRLREAEDAIEGFNELVAQHRGELTVTVTSATPLGKDYLTRLETTLKQSKAARAAKVLKISNKVRWFNFLSYFSCFERVFIMTGQP